MTAFDPESPITRILIIEDDEDLCTMLGTILFSKQRIIESAFTLSLASSYLQRFNPDIILLDQNLPDGKGFDFLKKITLSHPRAKIIMMTSQTFKDDEQHPLKSGASYFMPKPFTLQAIVQLIAHLCPAEALQLRHTQGTA